MNVRSLLEIRNPEAVREKIVQFIRDKVVEYGKYGAVFGLSGGIDSALVAFLATEAVGQDKTLALFMPERDSSPESRKHAHLVVDMLGIQVIEINLTGILRKMGVYRLVPPPLFFPRSFQEKYVINKYRKFQDEETTFLKCQKGGEGFAELMRGIAFLRSKHRLRMVMWYMHAEMRNYLVLGCCNKTEKLTGYFVKYGDSASDIDPIAGLYKTQVRQLARFVGVPEEIVEKPPAPDLMPGMTDEFALQMSYEKLDSILFCIEKNMTTNEIVREEGASEQDVEYVRKLFEISSHMRRMPDFPEP